jgi:glycosyltransferase involved in cell wall biosynthesis
MSKRLLVIGHDGYRAGAQIALLHLVKWLKANRDVTITVLLRRGGDLAREYKKIAPTSILNGRDIGRAIEECQPDLVYLNTVVSLAVAAAVKRRWACPVICHVHELEMSIARFCGLNAFRDAQRHVDGYIAASEAVRDNLVRNHGVRDDRVHRVYEPVAVAELETMAGPEARSEVRDELRVGKAAFIVGGCGTTDWRKAPDVFVQVAALVLPATPERSVHFVWLGGETSGVEWERLNYDIDRLQVRSIVHFVGPQKNPARWFASMDVFLLTSREDPFPLVCLEAGALGVPIVCFRDAGGIPEFVESDAGFVVPYLSTGGAADRILTLANSPAVRDRLGRRAAAKVRENYDINVVGRDIVAVLEKYW